MEIMKDSHQCKQLYVMYSSWTDGLLEQNISIIQPILEHSLRKDKRSTWLVGNFSSQPTKLKDHIKKMYY